MTTIAVEYKTIHNYHIITSPSVTGLHVACLEKKDLLAELLYAVNFINNLRKTDYMISEEGLQYLKSLGIE